MRLLFSFCLEEFSLLFTGYLAVVCMHKFSIYFINLTLSSSRCFCGLFCTFAHALVLRLVGVANFWLLSTFGSTKLFNASSTEREHAELLWFLLRVICCTMKSAKQIGKTTKTCSNCGQLFWVETEGGVIVYAAAWRCKQV